MPVRWKRLMRKLNTSQMIAGGFLALILTGGLILWLPFCAAPGETTTFSDAMFTAVTSVCITGLVTVTTATHWSVIGKVVILLLIQAGGIGVISMGSLVFLTLRKKLSMRSSKMIRESYNLEQMSDMGGLVKRVVLCVFGAELLGAVLYAFAFVPRFGWGRGLAQAGFTAVSAFCNAGIDILGDNSLASYVGDPLINLTTMGLIIVAGLGFNVWWDVGRRVIMVFRRKLSPGRMFKTLHLQSKLVLVTTAILLVGGGVLIFLMEYNNPRTMADMPLGTKVMASAFQSVTTRTAGFFTIDQAAFSNGTVLLCLILMFIGGSPMGTAGGVKTTTVAVLWMSVVTMIKGRSGIEFCGREIRNHYVRSAMVIVVMGFFTLAAACILLSAVMPGRELTDIVYELTSAMGTVGLSRNLTPQLTTAGKWIVMAVMYLGRIGPITLGTAVLVKSQRRPGNVHLAQEDIMIG